MKYKTIYPVSIAAGEGVRVLLELENEEDSSAKEFGPVEYGLVYKALYSKRVDGLTIKTADGNISQDDWEDIYALCSNMKWTPGLGNKTIWIWTSLSWEEIPLLQSSEYVKIFACKNGKDLIDRKKSVIPYTREKRHNPVFYRS